MRKLIISLMACLLMLEPLQAQIAPNPDAASIRQEHNKRDQLGVSVGDTGPLMAPGDLQVQGANVATNPLADIVASLVGAGVTVSNITSNQPATSNAYGTFTGGASSLGLNQGLLITSGDVANAQGPNTKSGAGLNLPTGGDALLNALATGTGQDATVISFDIVPNADILSFRYVFGSEEYNSFVNSEFNDVFGLFIEGPGIANNLGLPANTRNLALIPGAEVPIAINNVNKGNAGGNTTTANSNFYVNNVPTGRSGDQPAVPQAPDPDRLANVEYDGLTVVLEAVASVVPGQTYTLTFAVQDVGDGSLDSGVFIEGGSLTSVPVDGGFVSTTEGDTEVDLCPTNPLPGGVGLQNTSIATAAYGYFAVNVATDQVVATPTNFAAAFFSSPPSVYRIYGVSYTGNFTFDVGDQFSTLASFSDGESDLSTNFITVNYLLENCPTEGVEVTGFELYNADTDVLIGTLEDGDVIDLADAAYADCPALNIRALTSPEPTGRVRFDLNGTMNVRTENVSPYMLGGDLGMGTDYLPADIPLGVNTLTARPFDADNNAGTPRTITFTVLPIVKSFTLVNADTDADIGPLTDGMTLNLSTLPPNLNVRANTCFPEVGSVVFDFNGTTNFQTEEFFPYALGQDLSGDYLPGLTFQSGTNTLTATPYVGDAAGMPVGTPLSISFDVVTGNQPPTLSVKTAGSYCRGEMVNIQVMGTDPENGGITYELIEGADAQDQLPDNLSFDAATGTISGLLIRTGDEGTSTGYSVQVRGTDPMGLSDMVTVNIFSINCGYLVESFTLVNADTDADIMMLADGATLDLSALPPNLNVRANTDPAVVGSVVFDFNGVMNFQTESFAPYALGQDLSGDYLPGLTFPLGTNTLSAETFYLPSGMVPSVNGSTTIGFMVTSGGGAGAGVAGGKLAAYPQPFADELTVTLPAAERYEAELLDLTGRVLRRQQADGTDGTLTLRWADVPAGSYLLRLRGAGTVETLRVTKR